MSTNLPTTGLCLLTPASWRRGLLVVLLCAQTALSCFVFAQSSEDDDSSKKTTFSRRQKARVAQRTNTKDETAAKERKVPAKIISVGDEEFAIERAQALILLDPESAVGPASDINIPLDPSAETFDCPPGMPSTSMIWARGEIGLWWIEGFSTPPLVTSSNTGTARANAGVLGLPTTTIIYGNDRLAENPQLGGRVSLGTWLGPDSPNGVQVILHAVTSPQPSFYASSDGSPILARPFFNVEPGFEGEDAELTAFPGELAGSLSVTGETSFYGGEILYRRDLNPYGEDRFFDFVAGYRYQRLEDDLIITDFKRVLGGGGGLAVGTTLQELDRFNTVNEFHGGEVGYIHERRLGNLFLEGMVKVAVGNTHSKARISGATTATVPLPGGGTDVTVTGVGLYAQDSNIGTYEHDEFSVIPELGLNVWYEFLPNMRAGVGYTFIYWSRVARPGDLIDTDLNLSQLPPGPFNGISRPEFNWVFTDIWVQAINLGLDFRY